MRARAGALVVLGALVVTSLIGASGLAASAPQPGAPAGVGQALSEARPSACHGADEALDAPRGPRLNTMPSGVDDELLRDMAERLGHLPGFRDVHILLQGPPRFIAWFEAGASVPTDLDGDLAGLDVPYPVTARIVEGAVASGTGLFQHEALAPPLIPQACNNDRPGGELLGCTFAFLLSGSDGKTYAATAGHCIPQTGWSFSIGTGVYKVANGVGDDFGVIEIDPVLAPHMDPSMCHWGGPTGIATDGDLGDVLRMYGHGQVVGATEYTRPRSGLLESVGATSFTYLGPVTAQDSGAPVRLDEGPALGVHTHGLSGVAGVSVTGTPTIKWGMRLDAGIALAEDALGIQLTLLTAPVA